MAGSLETALSFPSDLTRRLWSGKDVVLQSDVEGHISPLSLHLEKSGSNIVAHLVAGDRFAVLQHEWGHISLAWEVSLTTQKCFSTASNAG
ncbi:MAG: hypothetical protein LN417_05860, partial [Candidatus Thermoplasmatota archaeon]|nr:hypothetical protein [Candidatus Thermoplasmatota archaeon]